MKNIIVKRNQNYKIITVIHIVKYLKSLLMMIQFHNFNITKNIIIYIAFQVRTEKKFVNQIMNTCPSLKKQVRKYLQKTKINFSKFSNLILINIKNLQKNIKLIKIRLKKLNIKIQI